MGRRRDAVAHPRRRQSARPQPPNLGRPRAKTARRDAAGRPADELIERYLIGREVLAAVRRHADAAKPNMEVGGELALERDRITRYLPTRNLCGEEGWFEPVRVPPSGRVLVHSHPGSRSAAASDGDIEWMRSTGQSRLGIFAPDSPTSELLVWHLDGGGNARAVPVVVEQYRPGPRLPPRRPGRRW